MAAASIQCSSSKYDVFPLGDLELVSGEILPGAFIAYKTFGDSRNPVILSPTCYAACVLSPKDDIESITICLLSMPIAVHDYDKIVSASNSSLNPSKYFIVITALIGNGESISPSNSPDLRENFPVITFADNVRAQYLLLTEKLGIKHVKAVIGFSMGGAQAYQWAVQYPEFMDVIVPICCSARTSIHNNVFLEGVKAALVAARGGYSCGIGKGQQFPSKDTWTARQRETGLKALGRVYAGWGFSQTWYREKLFEKHFGARDAEDFILKFWEPWALDNDPDDMLLMLRTWQLGDISAWSTQPIGDFSKALQSIKARALVVPSQTDLYFPPEDSQYEVTNMAPGRGTLAVIPSIWGHWAGALGDSKDDWAFLDKHMAQVFSELP